MNEAIEHFEERAAVIEYDGKVRGLLCHRCNVMIGGWDDKEWLEAAMRYMGVTK